MHGTRKGDPPSDRGGHTNRAIGEELQISEKTVETHRTRMMQKLDIHRLADLVRFALSAGLSP